MVGMHYINGDKSNSFFSYCCGIHFVGIENQKNGIIWSERQLRQYLNKFSPLTFIREENKKKSKTY